MDSKERVNGIMARESGGWMNEKKRDDDNNNNNRVIFLAIS